MKRDDVRSSGADDDRTWQAWREECKAIDKEVRDLVLSDLVFRLSMEALRRWPPERLNFMYGWLAATYARDCDISIRRLLDRDPDVLSLGRLLDKIKIRPQIVTVERFQSCYSDDLRDSAASEFEYLVGEDRKVLTSEFVEAGIASLLVASRDSGLHDLTNWRIAHNIPSKEPSRMPTWQHVHDCIAEIERVYLRYQYLLLQVDSKSLSNWYEEEVEQAVATFWLGMRLEDPGSLLRALRACSKPSR